MEEIKKGWKRWASWIFAAIVVVFVYKMLDNFSSIQDWFRTLFSVLAPFFAGILISYILFIPCRNIENACKKSKIKFVAKKARGLSVIATYLIFLLIIVIIINVIVPVISESIKELIGNIPNYYSTIIKKYRALPENSLLKSDIIKEKMMEYTSLDVKNYLTISNDKIIEYAKSVINVFSGLFDIFVAIVVSVYVLLQRNSLIEGLRRFSRAIFNKETYESVDKYFVTGNQVFFTYITSQLMDAIIVGLLTTIAMLILKVKYAPLLGFMIGLFNLIPYVGAIFAVIIGIIITIITGGIGKAIIMAIVVIVLQQIDANIINPKIIGSSLKISPLLVLFAVTVGGAYFGILGMFLGVPIAVVIKAIVGDYVENKNKIRDEEEKENKKKVGIFKK